MPQVIGTNVLSLNAQRNLNNTGSTLATSLQRLSSGLRINSAKDDAAGLAISNRMTAQIRGLNQAARNANDGISLAQTAEGDLAAVTTGLQRIRELAVQSANATNSTSDRQALQAEASQLIAEIDRISVSSSFNGVSLLDGSFTSQQFQVGANSGQTINVASIASSRTADLGQANTTSVSGTAVAAALSTGDLTVNGNAVAATSRDAAAIATAINNAASDVTATATNTSTTTFNTVSSATVETATTLDTSASVFTSAVSNAANAVAEVHTGSAALATALAASSSTHTATNNLVATDYSTDTVTFDIADGNGGTSTVTLNTNLTNTTGVIAEINADIGAGTADVTASLVGGKLTLTADTAGSARQVTVSNYDGDLDGNTTSVTDFTVGTETVDGRSQYDFSAQQVSFNVAVDGGTAQTVTLNTDTTNQTGFLASINGQLAGATATVVADRLVITSNNAGGTSDVVVSAFDGDVDSGAQSIADFAAGTTTTTGAAAVADTFTVELDGNQIISTAGVAGASTTVNAAALSTAITNFIDNDTSGNYSYTGTTYGADLVITRNDGADSSLNITSNFGGTAGQLDGASIETSTNGTTAAEATAPTYSFSIDGTSLDFTIDGANGSITGAELAGLVDALSGYSSSYSGTTLTITKDDGSNISISDSGADSDAGEGLAGGAAGGGSSETLYGTVSIATDNGVNLEIGGANAANAGLTAGTTNASLSGTTIADTDVSTVSGANAAIISVDAALDTINRSRGDLGAIQSRFESVVSSLSTTAENLSAARSRIQDADFAQETAALTKAQILQQAGISILSQANAQPQLVLSLLQ